MHKKKIKCELCEDKHIFYFRGWYIPCKECRKEEYEKAIKGVIIKRFIK